MGPGREGAATLTRGSSSLAVTSLAPASCPPRRFRRKARRWTACASRCENRPKWSCDRSRRQRPSIHGSRRDPRQRHAPLRVDERPGHPGGGRFGRAVPRLDHVPRPSPGGDRRSASPRTLRKAPGRPRTIDHNASTPDARSNHHQMGVASKRAVRSRTRAHSSAGQSSRPLRIPAHKPEMGSSLWRLAVIQDADPEPLVERAFAGRAPLRDVCDVLAGTPPPPSRW